MAVAKLLLLGAVSAKRPLILAFGILLPALRYSFCKVSSLQGSCVTPAMIVALSHLLQGRHVVRQSRPFAWACPVVL
jgi:hypothetical protein